jgi:hypothetical protein
MENHEEWEGKEGCRIAVRIRGLGSSRNRTSSKCAGCASHATNGELTGVGDSTGPRNPQLELDPQESNPPFRRLFNLLEESSADL